MFQFVFKKLIALGSSFDQRSRGTGRPFVECTVFLPDAYTNIYNDSGTAYLCQGCRVLTGEVGRGKRAGGVEERWHLQTEGTFQC